MELLDQTERGNNKRYEVEGQQTKRVAFSELKRYLEWIKQEANPEPVKNVTLKTVEEFYDRHDFVMTLVSN